MDSTFSAAPRVARSKIGTRAVTQAATQARIGDDWPEVTHAILEALAAFPEARAAVRAALRRMVYGDG